MNPKIVIVGKAGSDEVKRALVKLAQSSPNHEVMVVENLRDVIDLAMNPESIDDSEFVPVLELTARQPAEPVELEVHQGEDDYRSQPYRHKFFKKR